MFDSYQPSGRFSLSFLAWLLLAVGVVVGLAFVYQLGLKWSPLIYVNFLLTWGFAVAIGAIGSFVVKRGKVRNVPIAVLLFGVLVFAGIGAKFGFQYLMARSDLRNHLSQMDQAELRDWLQSLQQEAGDEEPFNATPEILEQFREEIYKGYSFVDHIQGRVDTGWVVGRRGNGPPVSGWFVALVWLIELGCLVKFGAPSTVSTAKKPFSEKLDLWADQTEVDLVLPITGKEMIDKIDEAESVQDLLELPLPTSDTSDQYAVYTVNSIPGEDKEDAYLSVELQTHTTNSKGEPEVQTERLVILAVLTAAQRELLRQNAEDINAAFAAYRASQQAGAGESAGEDENDGRGDTV